MASYPKQIPNADQHKIQASRSVVRAWTTTTTSSTTRRAIYNGCKSSSTNAIFQQSPTSRSTALHVQRRGLEQRRESATPTEDGMTLYLKAAEDGTSVGDCPFAHFVRLVLEEKGLPYELKPSTQETKPSWLVEYYEGKMPALRHGKECYVESGVIADYLEFFFPEPALKPSSVSEEVLDGFFPAAAQYLKTKEDQDEDKLKNLRDKLQILNEHLSSRTFLDGETFSLLDCRLLPQLYHLSTGIEGFKSGKPNLAQDYPYVQAYFERGSSRPSFEATQYSPDTILWGWGNARN